MNPQQAFIENHKKQLAKAKKEKKDNAKREPFTINLSSQYHGVDNGSILFFNSFVLSTPATFISAIVKATKEQKESCVVLVFTHEMVKVEITIPVHRFTSFTTEGYPVPVMPVGTSVSARYICLTGLPKEMSDFSVDLALTFN